MRIITRNIWILSFVSLLTDVSSEMLYPVMPVYLRHIGFSIAMIGLLEGFAEALAGLSKGYFGKMSDQTGKRLPFVQAGYFLSAISKPMMVVFNYPLWIFFARSTDRLGKGIRTGARDALLSDETTAANKARVFGFHRSTYIREIIRCSFFWPFFPAWQGYLQPSSLKKKIISLQKLQVKDFLSYRLSVTGKRLLPPIAIC
jgi:hypothetical protein